MKAKNHDNAATTYRMRIIVKKAMLKLQQEGRTTATAMRRDQMSPREMKRRVWRINKAATI